MKSMRPTIWLILFVCMTGVIGGLNVTALAQPYTHIVEQGDTLWDICEKYYGDSELWPKLWELNPFVTNPHLLKPGDVITLLERVPRKEALPAEEKESGEEAGETKEEKPEAAETPSVSDTRPRRGLDLTGIIQPGSQGFLSIKEMQPLGRVFSTEADKVLIVRGDVVYVAMETGDSLNPEQLHAVYNQSPLKKHPLTGDDLGYVITYMGLLRIEEAMNDFLYKAKVIEIYREIHVDDFIMPYEPAKPCIQLQPMHEKLSSNIVAVQDDLQLIGPFAVVYLDHGYDHGFRRGQLFEVVQERKSEEDQRVFQSETVIGYVLVVDARAKKSTGVVLASQKELQKGAVLRGIDWSDAGHVLSKIPRCEDN